MVWQALILHQMVWNFDILLVLTISNSLGKIIQFDPSLSIKLLETNVYFVIPELSGVICCGGNQWKLAYSLFMCQDENENEDENQSFGSFWR